jgi:porin
MITTLRAAVRAVFPVPVLVQFMLFVKHKSFMTPLVLPCVLLCVLNIGYARGEDNEVALALEPEMIVNDPDAVAEQTHLSTTDKERLASMAQSADRFNNLNIKGWNSPYMIGDTILKDKDGFRSALAEKGIGFVGSLMVSSAYNTLGTHHSHDPISYWGQEFSTMSINQLILTYDLSQYGVPDGQLAFGLGNSYATWRPYTPNRTAVNTLSYYQTLLDRALEIKVGFVGNGSEWIGTEIGGNSANPLGQSAAIPASMGLTNFPFSQPTFKVKWNITDKAYSQFGVMRSLPINGPEGNIYLDDDEYNQSGLKFKLPNAKRLLIGEIGYKNLAAPGDRFFWIRAGGMDNASSFTNYKSGGETDGVSAYYALADVQLTQSSPNSIFTAHQGLYLGGSYMRGPSKNLAFYEQYELKAYYYAPFGDSRPKDMLSLVQARNNVSSYLKETVNGNSSLTGLYATGKSDITTLMYTAYLTDGVWGTLGWSYTKDPAVTYKTPKDELSSVLFSIYARF